VVLGRVHRGEARQQQRERQSPADAAAGASHRPECYTRKRVSSTVQSEPGRPIPPRRRRDPEHALPRPVDAPTRRAEVPRVETAASSLPRPRPCASTPPELPRPHKCALRTAWSWFLRGRLQLRLNLTGGQFQNARPSTGDSEAKLDFDRGRRTLISVTFFFTGRRPDRSKNFSALLKTRVRPQRRPFCIPHSVRSARFVQQQRRFTRLRRLYKTHRR
jgi:hypothetical protein